MDFTRLNPVVRDCGIFERLDGGKERIAYDARLIYIISGGMTVALGNEKFKLSPSSLLYIPAGVCYKMRAQYARATIVAFDLTSEMPLPSERIGAATPEAFDKSLCHYTADAAPFDKPIFVEALESARDALLRASDLFVSAEGYYLAEASAIMKSLLLRVAETADENALPSRLVESLGEYIRENAKDDISNTEIGAVFGYHPFYISKLLKEKRGVTMRQYIISRRMKIAMSMLRLTGKSIAEIAEECGFSDASYFTKSFKSIFNMTPKEYRAQAEEQLI